MKILLVDDHNGIREMLRNLLATPDVELEECSDGKDALAAYRLFEPDWVFMDHAMKGLDGLSATRQILGQFPNARILMVTEEDIEQLRRAVRTAGAAGFITKEQLLRTLSESHGAYVSQLELLCAQRQQIQP